MSTVGSYGNGVEVVKRGHDLIVLLNGEAVRDFNEISDDYAYTNAESYARALSSKTAMDKAKESK